MSQKKILVPVTLTDGSLSSLLVGVRLAQELSATVVLFHVLPLGESFRHDEARRRLRQLATRIQAPATVEYLVSEGRAAEEIIWQAATLPADAIVMCTHRYCRHFAWLHRQTACKVLPRVLCPVWLVEPNVHADAVLLTKHDCPELAFFPSVTKYVFAPIQALFRSTPPIS